MRLLSHLSLSLALLIGLTACNSSTPASNGAETTDAAVSTEPNAAPMQPEAAAVEAPDELAGRREAMLAQREVLRQQRREASADPTQPDEDQRRARLTRIADRLGISVEALEEMQADNERQRSLASDTWWRNQETAAALGLSAQQATAVGDAHRIMTQTQTELGRQSRELDTQLQQALDNADFAAAESVIREQQALAAAQQAAYLDYQRIAHSQLDAEQWGQIRTAHREARTTPPGIRGRLEALRNQQARRRSNDN